MKNEKNKITIIENKSDNLFCRKLRQIWTSKGEHNLLHIVGNKELIPLTLLYRQGKNMLAYKGYEIWIRIRRLVIIFVTNKRKVVQQDNIWT
jgi:hypothetical protein